MMTTPENPIATEPKPGMSRQDLLAKVDAMEVELHELRQFRDMAYRDPLTALRNRRYFDVRFQEELHRAQRSIEGHCSVVMIDLDDLKKINDLQGHRAGDQALKWVASFLEGELRQNDICCRLGGDEFVLLLPDTDVAGRRLVMDRIWDNLRSANARLPQAMRFSMGGATWPVDGASAEALYEKADKAMYRSKRLNKSINQSDKVASAGSYID